MSVLRLSRPGLSTQFVDLGPSVGRVLHTRGSVGGGVIVVDSTPKKPKYDPEKERAAYQRYYQRHKDRLLEEQRQRRQAMRGAA